MAQTEQVRIKDLFTLDETIAPISSSSLIRGRLWQGSTITFLNSDRLFRRICMTR